MNLAPEPAIDPGPFGIDGPGFTDRDREMFVLGFEFARIDRRFESTPWAAFRMMIHAGNAERARSLCSRLNRRCVTTRASNAPGWCELIVSGDDS